MANFYKITVVAMFGVVALASVAEAMAINRCARILRDAAGRETVYNACQTCITVKVERSRPGQNLGTPNQRDFNIPGGTHQLLSFRGPGLTRIVTESACPTAGAPAAGPSAGPTGQ
ncbi:hypothetical protein [Magnetovibrio sp.]|uniref:hypothetical protein n=1 Tax=Magnetovibrio sp. TaxID=2024836 RepID=UPI002F94A471